MISKEEKNFRPDKVEKAFLYQQAAELNTPVAVFAQTALQDGKKAYSVTFVVDPKRINMKVRERGDTLFDACMKTKITAQKKLSRLADKAVHDKEREALVEWVKHSARIQ